MMIQRLKKPIGFDLILLSSIQVHINTEVHGVQSKRNSGVFYATQN